MCPRRSASRGTPTQRWTPDPNPTPNPAPNLDQMGAGGAGGEIFENEFSGMINDERLAAMSYDYSMEAIKKFL